MTIIDDTATRLQISLELCEHQSVIEKAIFTCKIEKKTLHLLRPFIIFPSLSVRKDAEWLDTTNNDCFTNNVNDLSKLSSHD